MKYIEDQMSDRKKNLKLVTWDQLSTKNIRDLIEDKHDRSTLENILEEDKKHIDYNNNAN